ncbi:MAG TPA: reverse transcriptase family protein [Bryobacteraceae bacterium]|nr:reverse transcriptase family protein [Bryobacteraceae bacterium]
MHHPSLLRVLARAFIAGQSSTDEIVSRASIALGKQWSWLTPLAQRYVANTAGTIRPRRRDVILFLIRDPGFRRACRKYADELAVEHWITESPSMRPVAATRNWDLPAITTAGDLASWLQVQTTELDWFADLKGLTSNTNRPPLHHYHYRLLPKSSRAVRLIEAPKSRLKELQRHILSGILEKIPAHPAVQGFVKGRSIRTFVGPHIGKDVVLRMDFCDFFPSIGGARIQALFRTIGYPESVADLLGGICTNVVPRDVWRQCKGDVDRHELWEIEALYARPHLPQGAPTSPALANICAYRMDCRLAGLAKSAGAQYTRYADDIAFSGRKNFADRVQLFSIYAAAIAMEEGFAVHHRKTRIMHQGVRQHLAGLVANRRVNVIRADFDRLKATLMNCVRHGPQTQNRDNHPDFRSHLEGLVGFVETINPEKAKRLRKLFNQIPWA